MTPRTPMPVVRPYGRLKLVAAGSVFALVGLARLRIGVAVTMNWYGQPVWSWGMTGLGVVCFLLAVVPCSRIVSAAAIKNLKANPSR